MRFERGEALVEQVVRERGMLRAQLTGEALRLGSLRTLRAIGMQRIAHHKRFYAVLANEAGDRFQVGAQRTAVQRKKWLRGESERVGNSEADAAIANIKREDTTRGHAPSVGA